MGAVYQAAALSKAFKVKPFLVRDAATFPIQVSPGLSSPGRGCHGAARDGFSGEPWNLMWQGGDKKDVVVSLQRERDATCRKGALCCRTQ